MIGRSHYDLFPDLPEQWKEIHQRCLAGAVEYSEADPFPRGDGSLDWVRWEIHPWRKIDGKIGGILILSEVITERKRAEEHIRKLHRTLGILSDINQAIVRIRHLPSLFEKACEIAVEKGTFRVAWIGLFDPKTGRIDPVARAGISDSDLEKLISTLNTPSFISALRVGERLICNDIQNNFMWRSWHEEAYRLGHRATVALPLIVAGGIRGIFNLYAGETDFFDEQEMRLIDEMAGDIAFAIEVAEQDEQRQRAEAAVKRYMQRMEILHQIDSGIIFANSIQEVVETTLKHIRQLIPCQHANVGLIDVAKGEGIIFAVDYDGDTALGKGLRVPIPQDFFDGYDKRHVKVIPDLRVLQETNQHFKQVVNEGLLCGVNVILIERKQPIGTLGLFANTPNFFTSEHQEIIIEVGNRIAVAIHQLQLSEELAQYATTLEQKVAERTVNLQAALVRVEAILNNSPDGILLVDSDLTIQQTNSSFNTLFGSEWDEYHGKSLLTLLHPDDVHAISNLPHIAIAQHHGRHIEVRAIRKNGTPFDAELNIGAIKGDGLVCIIRDISERKHAEEALRESEERFRCAIIDAPFPIMIHADNGEVLHISNVWTEISGYTHAEIPTMADWIEKAYRENSQPARALIEKVYRLTKPRRGGEFRIQTKAGEERIWDFISAPLAAMPDGRRMVSSMAMDITERKHAEETLQNKMAEERQFQLYLKALHEIIIELTGIDQLDTFYQRAVALGRERLGFERLAMFLYDDQDDSAVGTYGTDIQGNLVDERSVRFTPDPNGIMQRSFDRVERFYFKEETTLYNEAVPVGHGWNVAAVLWNGARSLGWFVADNLLSHVPASKPLLDTIGLYALSVGTLLAQKQAQLALKESEARYRLLAENLADVIMTFSLDRQITYMSPSCEKLLGYLPEEVQGKSQSEFIHPEDYPNVIARTRQAVASKEHSYTNQFRIRHKAGHYIWYEVRTRVVWELNTGNVVQFASVLRDITERKQAEDALRESEEKFRLLLDAAPVATIISDQTGRISLVNVQAEKLFGYGRDELTGLLVEILVPDYAHDSHVNNRITYVAAPRVRPMGLGLDLYARRKDGSEVPVEIELSYIETRNGIMVMSFIMDITARKRIAAELEQQRSFLRNVIDVSPSMIFVKDYDGRFILVNPSVAHMYNTTLDALVGKTDADFNPTQQEIDDFLAADRMVITSGELLFMEEPITNSSGKTHWLQTTKVPLVSADGQSKYVLGVSTDITERKEAEEALRESEEKYRSLVETMRGGLAVFDTEFRVTYVNDRFCELLGYTREEAIGKQPLSFVDAVDLPLVQSHLERRQRAESTSSELPLRHKDGHQIYVLMSGSPLLDKQGKYNGSIVVATDISIQKQAEATLRQALAKEKELSDLKTRFVSMASHEFRTPLATILALVETLSVYRNKLSEEQIIQRFDKIKAQIGHLKDIMEDILMLARMQARRVEFNPVKLDLDELSRSVLDEFHSHADIKHWLEYTVSEGIHEVLLDHKLMRQIISNLVSNAIKYSPQGTVVRIHLQYTDSEVILKISDEGIGIPETDLPHLFEPFHRAANVGTISGTGLGLVITREAVELHGGTITIESQQGVGTTFLIRIPIAA